MKETIVSILGVLVVVTATIILIFTGISVIGYTVDNVPIKVTAGQKVLYKGRSACVNVSTGGSASKVTIKGGLFCMLPKQYYVGNDVKVETMEPK